jgi:L-amino acid N-acyltransferase YncA
MSAYRFCRSDDIGLLVNALNRCWAPYVPGDPPITPATFKRSIRDLQVWCSSCMVAFSGPDPIGLLIGAKRPSGTLVHTIAVHPDHRRQGHGRHLLASLGSKLAILGPPRMIAEVPESFGPACELFNASGYVQEALLTDYVWQHEEDDAREPANERQRGSHASGAGNGGLASERAKGAGGVKPAGLPAGRFLIPITVDDLAANGLLEEPPPSPSASGGQVHPPVCWERSVETLTARKDEIAGLAVASDERIEACLLYVERPPAPAQSGPGEPRRDLAEALAKAGAEIVSLRTFVDDGGLRLNHLLSGLRARGVRTFRFPKVHPAEISRECLETLGFRAAGGHRLYAARARSE